MSLDVYLMQTIPAEMYSSNITHNLGKMADTVTLSNGQTLYQILWRPDECDPPYTKAYEILSLLSEGLSILWANPEEYKKYDPTNGWGSYEGLVEFVLNYRNACAEYPASTIEVFR